MVSFLRPWPVLSLLGSRLSISSCKYMIPRHNGSPCYVSLFVLSSCFVYPTWNRRIAYVPAQLPKAYHIPYPSLGSKEIEVYRPYLLGGKDDCYLLGPAFSTSFQPTLYPGIHAFLHTCGYNFRVLEHGCLPYCQLVLDARLYQIQQYVGPRTSCAEFQKPSLEL